MLVLYVKNHNIQFVHEINVREKKNGRNNPETGREILGTRHRTKTNKTHTKKSITQKLKR